MITAPILMAASIVSHSASTFPSMTSMRSPCPTPSAGQPVGNLRRPPRELRERERLAVARIIDDPQRRLLVAARR